MKKDVTIQICVTAHNVGMNAVHINSVMIEQTFDVWLLKFETLIGRLGDLGFDDLMFFVNLDMIAMRMKIEHLKKEPNR